MFDVNDDTKVRGHRVEVLTGPERRRRWSAEDKARIVTEASAPDANASAVARRWQICPQQVYAWRRELRAGLLDGPLHSAAAPAAPGFVPIVMAPSSATVEIELAGAVLRVPAGEPGLLAVVLRAVRASAAA